MLSIKSISRTVLAMFVVAASTAVIVSPASAAVGVTLSKSTALTDLEVITISLASVPAGQGVYISQCYKPQLGQRTATGLICNGSITETGTMIWATADASRGSQSVNDRLVLILHSSFTKVDANNVSKTYECGVANCAIYVYRDHRGISDLALDTIVPLKFLPSQDVSLAKLGLKKDGATFKAGTSVAMSAAKLMTTKGSPVVVSSTETNSICSTTGSTSFTIKFRKPGVCKVTLVADGSAKFDQMIKTLTYIVK